MAAPGSGPHRRSRGGTLLLLTVLAPFGVLPAAAQERPPIGGVGLLSCADVTGAAQAPYLAQVGDWALGYMAGRIDAGQSPVAGAALSPARAGDVVTAIAIRCRQAPDMIVAEAVRSVAQKIFAAPAQGGPLATEADPDGADEGLTLEHAPRPRPRPEPPRD